MHALNCAPPRRLVLKVLQSWTRAEIAEPACWEGFSPAAPRCARAACRRCRRCRRAARRPRRGPRWWPVPAPCPCSAARPAAEVIPLMISFAVSLVGCWWPAPTRYLLAAHVTQLPFLSADRILFSTLDSKCAADASAVACICEAGAGSNTAAMTARNLGRMWSHNSCPGLAMQAAGSRPRALAARPWERARAAAARPPPTAATYPAKRRSCLGRGRLQSACAQDRLQGVHSEVL